MAFSTKQQLGSGGGGGTITGGGNSPDVAVWNGPTSITDFANFKFYNAIGKGQLVVGTALLWQKDNSGSLGAIDDLWFGEGAGRTAATSIDGRNTGVGYLVGSSLTTGSNNSMFGQASGVALTTGSFNSFFGSSAGRFTSTGDSNSFFGEEAGYTNTTGHDGVAFGYQALFKNTTGRDNLAIGSIALHENISGHENVALGNQTLYKSTSNNNTALGFNALLNNITGSDNTAVGHYAGLFNVASGSVFIGGDAGITSTSGGLNTIIGASADVGTSAVIGAIAIGYKAIAIATNTMTIGGDQASNGHVGTIYWGSGAFDTNPIGQLEVKGTSAAVGSGSSGTNVVINGGNGDGAGFDGYVSVNNSRFMTSYGNGTAAASTITLAQAGNTFNISGNTTINLIDVARWNAGADICLVFSGTPTLTHNSGGSGSMLLAGSIPAVVTAGSVFCFKFNGNNWMEISRTIA